MHVCVRGGPSFSALVALNQLLGPFRGKRSEFWEKKINVEKEFEIKEGLKIAFFGGLYIMLSNSLIKHISTVLL